MDAPKRSDSKDLSTSRHLIRLKLGLTLLVMGFWLAHLAVDERMMVSISGAAPSDLDYWNTKGAGFALIAAVGIFVSLIPTPKALLADLAPKVVAALAALSSGYFWLAGGTGGNIGGYIVAVVVAGVFIAIGLLATPVVVALGNVSTFLMNRAEQAIPGKLGRLLQARRERLDRPVE